MAIRRLTGGSRFSTAVAIATAAWVLTLTGCGPAVRWDDAPPPGSYYVVRAGDTLYEIATRYGVDSRDLAKWNGISNPELIYPGQRLRLTAPSGASRSAAASRSSGPGAQKGRPSKPLPEAVKVPPPAWLWPADGPVISRFGDSGSLGKGIGIGGKQGGQVRAAAGGRVVYTGTGLMGYGQLVIIKHNDTYLSAYAHSDSVSVSQGDSVKAGQVIARMGRGPGGKFMLHFEIRRNGVPIDPMTQLPRQRS